MRGIHRDRLIEKGIELLGRQGFAATGVSDITAACGVPKGSFYNYFASKDEFGRAVIEAYGTAAAAGLEQALAGSGSHLERLRRFYEGVGATFADGGFAGGCLAGRLAQELAGEHPQFRAPLERAFAAQRKVLARHLAAAAEAGELAPDLDSEVTAELLLSASQGALLRAKAMGSDAPLRAFLSVVFDRLLLPVGQAAATMANPPPSPRP